MKASKRETISRWILTLAALTSLTMAFGLAFNRQWPNRTWLIQQHILDAAIGLFGVLAAGFIAAIALLYVNRQIQTYSWRRDQALKDVERLYEPLYGDLDKAVKALETFSEYTPQGTYWNLSVRDSYLGTKLELTEGKLHGRLKTLFGDLENYSDKSRAASDSVITALRSAIEQYLDESVGGEERLRIADVAARLVNAEGHIFHRILMERPIEEWSSEDFGFGEENVLERVRDRMRGLGYAQYLQRAIEALHGILAEIFRQVYADARFAQFRDWCRTLKTEAAELKKELEQRILEPQLP